MSKYKIALFDCDGTIANTDTLIVETFKELYKKYRPSFNYKIEDIYYFSGPPIKLTLEHEFPFIPIQDILDEYHALSKSKYDDLIESYPDVKNVLLNLKEKGVKLGVITNKLHATTEYCLKCLGLENIVDVIIASDDVKVGKPNQEAMKKALNFFSFFDKSKVIYVGDNKIDDDFAFNSHVDSLIMTWGPRKQVFTSHFPTYLAINFKEVEGIILYGKQ